MKIGISQRILYHNGIPYDSIDQNWYRFLKDFEIYTIPNRVDQNFKNIVSNIDLFIISGGDSSPLRTKVETMITNEMMLHTKPILGVCHGAFFLNSFFSGTITTCNDHYNTTHKVMIDDEKHIVNSFHQLQIATPPPGSSVLAVDLDGFCESWIFNNIGAIVWHPERMENPVIPKTIIDNFFK